jgi:hypothetical protein
VTIFALTNTPQWLIDELWCDVYRPGSEVGAVRLVIVVLLANLVFRRQTWLFTKRRSTLSADG